MRNSVLSLILLVLLFATSSPAQRQSAFQTFDALTAAGQTPAFNAGFGSRYPLVHTVQLSITSLPDTCTFQLEGCLLLGPDTCDASDWELLSAANVDCTSIEMVHVVDKPVRNIRVNLTALAGTGATAKAPVETLDEVDFATHVEWDVTGGFVDSGGDAVYTHTPLEVLTELDFATHANWAAAGDMTDSTGAAVYTHSSGTGTLTQASGGFANAMVADVGYTFSYTVSSFSADVACDITTAIASATTALTMSDGAQTTTFTSAASPGDFIISCTSASGAVTIDDVTLKRVDHSATLTQVDTAYVSALVASKLYTFLNTVSDVTGTPICQITSGQTGAAVDLIETNGAQIIELTSSATITDDFVITCSSNVVGETITFDDVSWFEQNVTNASPIVVTTSSAHGYSNGFLVTIVSVVGNTAANVTDTAIANITSTTFELVGTTGNAPWVSGGTITSDPSVTARYLGVR